MNAFLLAQLNPKTFWNVHPDKAWPMIAVGIIIGLVILGLCLATPPQFRNKVVGFFTFIAGLPYVLALVIPTAINREPNSAPRNAIDGFKFFVEDIQGPVGDIGSILAGFILLLGVISLLRYHLLKVAKQQKDWAYSIVLVVSLVLIAFAGFKDYTLVKGPEGEKYALLAVDQQPFFMQAKDFMFDGMLQAMDAAMFSIIAFYILSAAYRAFRLRSVEATVLLSSAFIIMLSLLGAFSSIWDNSIARGNPTFSLAEIAQWIKTNMQGPAIRGIDFGVGVGLVAMGLRIWLNLDRTSNN